MDVTTEFILYWPLWTPDGVRSHYLWGAARPMTVAGQQSAGAATLERPRLLSYYFSFLKSIVKRLGPFLWLPHSWPADSVTEIPNVLLQASTLYPCSGTASYTVNYLSLTFLLTKPIYSLTSVILHFHYVKDSTLMFYKKGLSDLCKQNSVIIKFLSSLPRNLCNRLEKFSAYQKLICKRNLIGFSVTDQCLK